MIVLLLLFQNIPHDSLDQLFVLFDLFSVNVNFDPEFTYLVNCVQKYAVSVSD